MSQDMRAHDRRNFTTEGEYVLATPMGPNNAADARNVGDYVVLLGLAALAEGEEFSGKRPFGNGGWEYDVAEALAAAAPSGCYEAAAALAALWFDAAPFDRAGHVAAGHIAAAELEAFAAEPPPANDARAAA